MHDLRHAMPTTTVTRRKHRRRGAFGALAGAALVLSACLGPVTKLDAIAPPRFAQTSDPAVVRVGGDYYIYGSNNQYRAPIRHVTDINRSYGDISYEGMPTKPAWTASNIQLWAPTVGQFGSRWVMFFSADRPNPPQPDNAQCIGRAWADSPAGPFTPEPSPVTCGLGGVGGALDPQLLWDATGAPHLLAALGNTESPLQSFPLDGDANIVGEPAVLLSRQHPWEYHFIEQPAMIWDPVHNNYILTYSAGKWWLADYSTGIARCMSPAGPCYSDPTGPWVSASAGRTGPGGMSFFYDADGAPRAILSSFAAGGESTNGGRSASLMYVKFDPAMALTVVK